MDVIISQYISDGLWHYNISVKWSLNVSARQISVSWVTKMLARLLLSELLEADLQEKDLPKVAEWFGKELDKERGKLGKDLEDLEDLADREPSHFARQQVDHPWVWLLLDRTGRRGRMGLSRPWAPWAPWAPWTPVGPWAPPSAAAQAAQAAQAASPWEESWWREMCKEESPAQATVNHSALQHLERFESLVLLVQLQHSSPHWALAALALSLAFGHPLSLMSCHLLNDLCLERWWFLYSFNSLGSINEQKINPYLFGNPLRKLHVHQPLYFT